MHHKLTSLLRELASSRSQFTPFFSDLSQLVLRSLSRTRSIRRTPTRVLTEPFMIWLHSVPETNGDKRRSFTLCTVFTFHRSRNHQMYKSIKSYFYSSRSLNT